MSFSRGVAHDQKRKTGCDSVLFIPNQLLRSAQACLVARERQSIALREGKRGHGARQSALAQPPWPFAALRDCWDGIVVLRWAGMEWDGMR